jgi:FeS assembly SUF system protein
MNTPLSLHDRIIERLKDIYDPEIPVNIVDLGLIYDLTIDGKILKITMTLTNPACPVAGEFPAIVQSHIQSLNLFDHIEVHLVFDPPWTIDRMSDAAKLTLGV